MVKVVTAPDTVRVVVLVLHGGRAHSRQAASTRRTAYLRMVPIGRMLADAVRTLDTAVWLLRYRYRGWNDTADPVDDVRWALGEVARRHPEARVILVGHSMGGRAALYAADAANVSAVCALAPWIEPGDPIEPLRSRSALLVHGDRDRMTDPRRSRAFADRAAAAGHDVAFASVRGSGHAMLSRVGTWNGLIRGFVLRHADAPVP